MEILSYGFQAILKKNILFNIYRALRQNMVEGLSNYPLDIGQQEESATKLAIDIHTYVCLGY